MAREPYIIAMAALILLAALFIAGGWLIGDSTDGVSDDGETSGKGTLTLLLTDAPTVPNITQVDVTIASVAVHVSSNGSANESTGEWMTVVSESQTFDLIALLNVTTALGSAELDAGHYTQIRLHVASATATINGTSYNLTVPSEKIHLANAFTIAAQSTTTLTLDFDAHESIHKAGDSYILQPVIRIIES